MTVENICLALSGLLSVLAFVPYIHGVLKRTIIPEKATWIVWWVVDMTGLLSMYFENSVSQQMLAVAGGCTVTTVLALRYGKPGWSRLDQYCIGTAVCGIMSWAALEDPRVGLLSFSICNWIGFIPTLKSAWNQPETQKNPVWLINGTASALALVGMPDWTLAHATAPVTFLLMNALILLILNRPRATSAPTA